MQTTSTPTLTSAPRNRAVVMAPGEKFFVRRIPLAPEGDAAAQVALALESLSPFPAAQLYYGFRTDAGGTQALVFAAYRKNFSVEEIATWIDAAAVLPDFIIWLGTGSIPAAGVRVREHDGRSEIVAWDGRSELPAAIVVRGTGVDGREALIRETAVKAGLTPDTPARIFQSGVETAREKGELVVRLGTGGTEVHFDETALRHADIRDKTVLGERQRTARRDTLLWRGFAAVMAGLAACFLLEAGLLGTGFWLVTKRAEVTALEPTVKKIDQAQSLAKRLEEISAQRLLPFEMMAVLQEKRPDSVRYMRMSTNGLWRMDIEAQTTNAGDLRDFEAEVRNLPAVAHVELRDPRFREGVTTFQMEVTFKPGWYKTGAGT